MTDFYIKQNDLLPILQAVCKNETTGLPEDLTAATGVRFHMIKPGASVEKVDNDASFGDKALGEVNYTWGSGDTDEVGEYDAEFEVTFSSGILTFPNWKQLKIKVTGDVS